jgi:N-acyl-D-aspartate/D-glutamate deacylase
MHIRRFGAADCFIFHGLPAWEAIKGSADLKQKLEDKSLRAKLERERIEGAGKPEFPEWLGWDRVVFERVEKETLKGHEGKNVEEIARATGKAPIDAFCDTLIADDLASRLIFYGWANAHLDRLAEMIKSPQGLIGTDARAHSGPLVPRKEVVFARSGGAEDHRAAGREAPPQPRPLDCGPACRHHGFRSR